MNSALHMLGSHESLRQCWYERGSHVPAMQECLAMAGTSLRSSAHRPLYPLKLAVGQVRIVGCLWARVANQSSIVDGTPGLVSFLSHHFSNRDTSNRRSSLVAVLCHCGVLQLNAQSCSMKSHLAGGHSQSGGRSERNQVWKSHLGGMLSV